LLGNAAAQLLLGVPPSSFVSLIDGLALGVTTSVSGTISVDATMSVDGAASGAIGVSVPKAGSSVASIKVVAFTSSPSQFEQSNRTALESSKSILTTLVLEPEKQRRPVTIKILSDVEAPSMKTLLVPEKQQNPNDPLVSSDRRIDGLNELSNVLLLTETEPLP
jgi:hypothetical protein